MKKIESFIIEVFCIKSSLSFYTWTVDLRL
jgi:hypothetical protein